LQPETFAPENRSRASQMMDKILILDENASANSFLGTVLQRELFVPILVDSPEAALQSIWTMHPDLLILGVPLAGTGAVELCMQLKMNQIHNPVIVLSDQGDEIDKVLALEAGADDYIVKPFAVREFVARIRAVLRRRRGNQEAVIRFGNVEVDRQRRTVTCLGQEVKVSPFEYRLLLFFLGNVDLVLTRRTLLSCVWGYSDNTNTRTVDEHVCKLRKKFESDPSAPRHFLTIHGIGYRFLM
jgi:DNA-binding response OmpR family regulator